MQQSQHRSQCWKHCLKSSTEMLSRATTESLAALDSISVGSGAETAAYIRRGRGASKGTKVSNLYKYFKYIFFNNSGNFWVPPRIILIAFSRATTILPVLFVFTTLNQFLTMSGYLSYFAPNFEYLVSICTYFNY